MVRAGEDVKQVRVPQRVAGVRIAELPLSPEDAFIWSQLDGRTRPTEVSELTGMDESAVRATLTRLEQLGAVHYGVPKRDERNERDEANSGIQRRDPRRDETERPPPVSPLAAPRSRRDPRRDPTEPPPAQMSTATGTVGVRSSKRDPRRDKTVPPAAPAQPNVGAKNAGADKDTVKPGLRAALSGAQATVPAVEPSVESRSARPHGIDRSSTSAPRSDAGAPAPTPREDAPGNQRTTEATRTESVEIALTEEQQQRIDIMFEQLEGSTHYALLGVAPDAVKKDIKAAYFELIAFFHPDKFFRKELGDYKRKLEQIFQRLTEANEVLTRKGPRAEYDQYLEARQRTRAMDAVMTSIPPPPPRSVAPPPPRAPVIDMDLPPLSAEEATSGADPSTDSPRSEATPEERSQALARRLAAGKAIGKSKEAPAAAPLDEAAVAEQLKRMVQSRRSPQVTKFVQAGKDALAESAWVSAVNALRIALTMAPDDDEIRALYEEADEKAAAKLADSYESRARYEEKSGDHDSAAQSWECVANARKEDDKPLRRAAECYANTSAPRRGIAPGRAAVLLTPNSVKNRFALAKVYEVCGMTASAIAEAMRALALKPDDAELNAMLARLQPNK
ncbi:MAG TPA: DnaJ domain-containing protein [Polyangiaceae bacterium]|nr:DnaJ domain-containing protein [Polyangiaceae bacterium]